MSRFSQGFNRQATNNMRSLVLMGKDLLPEGVPCDCTMSCMFSKVLGFSHCAKEPEKSPAWSDTAVAFVWFFFSWKKGRAVKSKEMPLGMGNTSASSVKTSTKTTSNQMFQQTGCCPRFHVASSAGSPKFWGFPTVPKKDNHAPGRWS